jgi:hypothetical protein
MAASAGLFYVVEKIRDWASGQKQSGIKEK